MVAITDNMGIQQNGKTQNGGSRSSADDGYTFFPNPGKTVTHWPWYIHLVLNFLPKKFVDSEDYIRVVYKKFRGVYYILDSFVIPPEQYNCRCKWEKV